MSNLDDGMIVVEHRKDIPKFTNEEEERAFWDTHTLAPSLFTRRGPRPGGLLEKVSRDRFKPHVVMSKEADAAYVYLRWGRPACSKELGNGRIVDYADGGQVLGVRFLRVSHGLEVDDIPEHDEIRALLKNHNPPINA